MGTPKAAAFALPFLQVLAVIRRNPPLSVSKSFFVVLRAFSVSSVSPW